jgi:hypothetical protein
MSSLIPLNATRQVRKSTSIKAASEESISPVPPFPLDVLPNPVRRVVEEGARALHCPSDLIAVPALVALGTALGTRRSLEVKPGWVEFPSLYAAIIAEPGSAKSPGQNLATSPLHAAQARLRKEGGSIVSTDATIEALALALKRNPLGMLYEQDELSALTAGFNRYRRGIGADRQFFQAAWSGKLTVTHRVKLVEGVRQLDTLEIPRPFLCVLGGLPPELLGELSDERGREDGFIHRFLFCYPDSIIAGYSEEGVSSDARRQYQELVDSLMQLPAASSPMQMDTVGAAWWLDCIRTHIAEINSPEFPEQLRGPWRKLEAYAARFCVIFQSHRSLVEAADVDVSIESVEDAWRLVDYFKAHARKIYGQLKKEPLHAKAVTMVEFIAGQGGFASTRDILTNKVAGCKNKGQVQALFEVLARTDLGQIEVQDRKTGGLPTIGFRLRS